MILQTLIEKYLWPLATISVLVAFFCYFLTPIWDIDFWWHIATGRQIFQTHVIPATDPFSVYNSSGVRSETVLRANWLAQVIWYLAFAGLGFWGIALLKAAILTVSLFFIAKRGDLLGASKPFTLLTLFLAGMVALNYTSERPQLFSFFFAALIYFLLDRYWSGRKKYWPLFLVPVAIIFWGNSHGGVALAFPLLILAVTGVLLAAKTRIKGIAKYWAEVRLPAGILLLAILATLLNPNSINTYIYIFQFQGSDLQSRTTEYLSPIVLWQQHGIHLPFYWLFLLAAIIAAAALIKKGDVHSVLVILFLAFLSLSAFRYIPFFVFIAAPYVASGLSQLGRNVGVPERPALAITTLAALGTIIYGIYTEKAFQVGLRQERFPVQAVNFMEERGLSGKIFNHINWGGYLLWRLHPAAAPFRASLLIQLILILESKKPVK